MTNTLLHAPRILVVGGNGFIGSHIVNHALELGWDVTSLGLTTADSSIKTSNKFRYVSADISNIISLRSALLETSFEYVVNCGGYIDHSQYLNGGRNILDTHFSGVLNLVEILDRSELKAFINIGSSDEYGDLVAPQNESCREAPISSYSMGKVAATHFLQMLWRTEHFPATTLRLFLTYGPGQNNRRFLPQIIKGCLEDRSFPTSLGEQLRDFCYVEDVVNAIFAAFSIPNARGEVINIASGEPISIRNMIDTVRSLIGHGNPLYGEVAYRTSENMALYADIARAKEILNWNPLTSLEKGLAETINSVKLNLCQ